MCKVFENITFQLLNLFNQELYIYPFIRISLVISENLNQFIFLLLGFTISCISVEIALHFTVYRPYEVTIKSSIFLQVK